MIALVVSEHRCGGALFLTMFVVFICRMRTLAVIFTLSKYVVLLLCFFFKKNCIYNSKNFRL